MFNQVESKLWWIGQVRALIICLDGISKTLETGREMSLPPPSGSRASALAARERLYHALLKWAPDEFSDVVAELKDECAADEVMRLADPLRGGRQ